MRQFRATILASSVAPILDDAVTSPTQRSRAMRIVDKNPRTMCSRQPHNAGEWGNIAVHGKHAVRHDECPWACALGEYVLEVLHVLVRVNVYRRVSPRRHPDAIDQTRVVERVGENGHSGSVRGGGAGGLGNVRSQGGQNSAVCLIPGTEQHCVVVPGELSQGSFRTGVDGEVSRGQAAASSSGTIVFECLGRGCDHIGMFTEPQIIAGREEHCVGPGHCCVWCGCRRELQRVAPQTLVFPRGERVFGERCEVSWEIGCRSGAECVGFIAVCRAIVLWRPRNSMHNHRSVLEVIDAVSNLVVGSTYKEDAPALWAVRGFDVLNPHVAPRCAHISGRVIGVIRNAQLRAHGGVVLHFRRQRQCLAVIRFRCRRGRHFFGSVGPRRHVILQGRYTNSADIFRIPTLAGIGVKKHCATHPPDTCQNVKRVLRGRNSCVAKNLRDRAVGVVDSLCMARFPGESRNMCDFILINTVDTDNNIIGSPIRVRPGPMLQFGHCPHDVRRRHDAFRARNMPIRVIA